MAGNNSTKMDELLFSIADEANAQLDYAAMFAVVSKKAAARQRRAKFIKIGSMAAVLIMLVCVGTVWVSMGASGENTAEAFPMDNAAAETYGLQGSMDDIEEAEAACPAEAPPQANEARDCFGTTPTAGTASGSADTNGIILESQADSNAASENGPYWQSGALAMPEIDFGTDAEIIQNDEHTFVCRVNGCAPEDAAQYFERLAAALDIVHKDAAGMSLTLAGGQTIRLEFADNVLTVTAEQ